MKLLFLLLFVTSTALCAPGPGPIGGGGGVTSVNGFTGAVVIETGSLATALANQVIVAKQNGQSFFVSATTSTIASAFTLSSTNDTIIVGAGIWPANVIFTPNNAHSFYLESGAIITNSGNVNTFTDAGANCGIINIGGFGSFQNSGSSTSIFAISGSGTQLNVQCGNITMSTPSLSGTSIAAIRSNVGGYINLHAASISCSNCSAIESSGDGSFFIQSDDLIATTGSGISTTIIGNGFPGNANQREIPHWLTCKRFVSDPNERVFYVPNGINTQQGFFYINADRIAGCLEDGINSNSSIYVRNQLWAPQMNHDGSIPTSTRTLSTWNCPTSYYNVKAGTVYTNGPSAFVLAGGEGFTNQLVVVLSYFDVDRIYGSSSINPSIISNPGTQAEFHCPKVYNLTGVGLVFNGDALTFIGDMLGQSPSVTLNARGCFFLDSQINGITPNSNIYNYFNSTFGGSIDSGDTAPLIYPGPTNVQPVSLATSGALYYPDGSNLATPNSNPSMALWYPDLNVQLADATGNLYYSYFIGGPSQFQPVLADVNGSLYWPSNTPQSTLINTSGDLFDFNNLLIDDGAEIYYVGGTQKVVDDNTIYYSNNNIFTDANQIYAPDQTPIVNGTGSWIGPVIPWNQIGSTPTTLAGYGITDAVVKTTGTGSASISANGLLVGQMSETNISTPGTLVGDSPTVIPPVNPPSFISWSAYVKTTGTTTLRLTAFATVTGTAQVWGIKTIR